MRPPAVSMLLNKTFRLQYGCGTVNLNSSFFFKIKIPVFQLIGDTTILYIYHILQQDGRTNGRQMDELDRLIDRNE